MTRTRRNLLIMAVVCGLCLLALYLLPGCQRKPDPTAHLIAQRDAYRDSLALCRGQFRQQLAQLKYGQIAKDPAAAWPDSAIERGLANPYGDDLHAPRAGR
ncbi:hypothetical protein LJ737_20660 [Hymenobacter sp. 15J16-1T3B]|uniref:hypothetical protein n=1 Tax=Hymenobacter sp. 15J16-1T3B TaxID=2886941 RepID=UPI001D11CB2E|nr:hypothetical protein [Hymenobacter sp. 15J16-1T3B]MCC3159665.1 hypothetical protein [Hymenobacter sp. 15J16-1T3B]